MKKTSLLNSEVSYIIAQLGHTDTIVIADAGLPVPENIRRVDLALIAGVPSFLQTLRAILTELNVEGATIAVEMKQESPQLYKNIKEILKDTPITEVAHEELKNRTNKAKCVIRTGEFTPYANIILHSGVVF